MNTDQLLSIWNEHNITIIESLIALVILLSLFLAFRSFFGGDTKSDNQHRTLVKDSLGEMAPPHRGTLHGDAAALDNEESSLEIDMPVMAEESEEQTRQILEKDQKIAQLEAEVTTLKSQQVEAVAPVAAPANAEGGEQVQDLQKQVEDLQSRLNEYEIISEDLADISRLKKENEDLRRQLEALRESGAAELSAAEEAQNAAGVAPSAGEVLPDVTPSESRLQEDSDKIIVEGEGEQPEELSEELQSQIKALSDQNVEVSGESVDIVEETQVVKSKTDDSVVDDEFMAEFQEAVMAQRNLDKNAESIGKETKLDDTSVEAQNIDEDDIDMLNQFGEFAEKKKS